MAEKSRDQGNKGQNNQSDSRGGRDNSIGNQQGTAQTGGQNAGGNQRHDHDDEFTDDLRNSGNRKSRDESGS